jgi:hypothetical protein
MSSKRQLTRADILSAAEYAKVRKERRAAIIAKKNDRRLEVGPVATFHFESFDSMWLQVQEMLHIERGGEAQIEGELEAYNPLIPRGDELVATVLFEIDEPVRRKAFLARIGGIEQTAFIRVGEATIKGIPEADVDRTTAEGKASSVQFIRFRFAPAEIESFREGGAPVVVGFTHPAYGHSAVVREAVRKALAADFD